MSTTPQPYYSAESMQGPRSPRTRELLIEAGNRTFELHRATEIIVNAVRPAVARADAIINAEYMRKQADNQKQEVERAELEAAQTAYGLSPDIDEIIVADKPVVVGGALSVEEKLAQVYSIHDRN